MILINVLKRKTSSKNFNEKKNINCHATTKKQINDQTTNEKVTMINAIDEIFNMHRRLILTIALKIDDRNKKNKNFIAVVIDEANETNEKKVNTIIVIDETTKKK